jgi:hypothetical protein
MTNVTFSPESSYLRPGDMATISFDNTKTAGMYDSTTGTWVQKPVAHFVGEDIKQSVYVGTPFKVSIIDKESGQTVYTSTVVMNP